MIYKVFLSHSTSDLGIVRALASLLSKFGAKVEVAEWYLAPGESLNKKVLRLIDGCDCVVALLTKNGIRSNWVQQEIGYALNSKKSVIPLVEKGISQRELAALGGKEYIEYDPFQPHQALIKTCSVVKSLKLKKETALFVAGAIFAFFLLVSGGER